MFFGRTRNRFRFFVNKVMKYLLDLLLVVIFGLIDQFDSVSELLVK